MLPASHHSPFDNSTNTTSKSAPKQPPKSSQTKHLPNHAPHSPVFKQGAAGAVQPAATTAAAATHRAHQQQEGGSAGQGSACHPPDRAAARQRSGQLEKGCPHHSSQDTVSSVLLLTGSKDALPGSPSGCFVRKAAAVAVDQARCGTAATTA